MKHLLGYSLTLVGLLGAIFLLGACVPESYVSDRREGWPKIGYMSILVVDKFVTVDPGRAPTRFITVERGRGQYADIVVCPEVYYFYEVGDLDRVRWDRYNGWQFEEIGCDGGPG